MNRQGYSSPSAWPPPGPVTSRPINRRPAGLLARVVAAGLDLIFVHLLYTAAFLVTSLLLWAQPEGKGIALLAGVGTGLLCYLVSFPLFVLAYLLVMHGWQGQTLGKMFLGLRVVTSNGDELTMGISFLRLIGTFLSLLPLGLGFFWCLFDLRGRAWHDLLAATLVVEK